MISLEIPHYIRYLSQGLALREQKADVQKRRIDARDNVNSVLRTSCY